MRLFAIDSSIGRVNALVGHTREGQHYVILLNFSWNLDIIQRALTPGIENYRLEKQSSVGAGFIVAEPARNADVVVQVGDGKPVALLNFHQILSEVTFVQNIEIGNSAAKKIIIEVLHFIIMIPARAFIERSEDPDQSESIIVELLRSHADEESVIRAAVEYAALVCSQVYRLLLACGEAVLDFIFRKNFKLIIKNQSIWLTSIFTILWWP